MVCGIFDLFCGQFLPYKVVKKVKNRKTFETKKLPVTLMHIILKFQANCCTGSKVTRCRSKITYIVCIFCPINGLKRLNFEKCLK
jgi:hypothetical protein